MSRFLVVYASSHGQTGKVVSRIADRLNDQGHEVTLWNADALPDHPALDRYDALVVAGAVRYGRYQRALGDFVRWNLASLNTMPSAFVSVCGVLAGSHGNGKSEAREYINEFCRQTGWQPGLTRSFAGAVRYTQYDLITRMIMKLISWRVGRPTDTSRDWEFTDWDAVDRFASEELTLLGAPLQPRRPLTGAGR
jgi:menaquinone-dependent protoporphyrinogen oxidase